MMACSVLSLASGLIILGTSESKYSSSMGRDFNHESARFVIYFCAIQTVIFSAPGVLIWFKLKCLGYCCCQNGLSDKSIELLFGAVYILTLANIITMTLINPMFFWNGLTALQRSFASIDVIITVTYTILFEIRVFLLCTTREERQRAADMRITLMN